MLKLTKKADYGLMAMKHLAEHAEQGACSAKDVADAYRIPQEALAKILAAPGQGRAAPFAAWDERRLHAGSRSGNDLGVRGDPGH